MKKFLMGTFALLSFAVLLSLSMTFIISEIDNVEKSSNDVVSTIIQAQKPEDYVEVVNLIEFKSNTLDMEIPNIDNSFKSYMDYRHITDKTSKQYEMKQESVTDGLGFRKYNGMYMIAVGSYYSKECGDEFKITLDNGERKKVINCVVGDLKQDIHTNKTNQYVVKNGNMIEFIIDEDVMEPSILKSGSVSGAGLDGKVVKIEKIVKG